MICSRCRQDKPNSEFYSFNKYYCKTCHIEYTCNWRRAHPRQVRKWNKHSRDNPHHKAKQSEYYKIWYRQNGRRRKGNYADSIKLWQRENPEKVKAAKFLQKALRKGIINKPIYCSACGVICELIGHHADYNKPLAVSWLCTSCHKKIHSG